MQQGKACVVKPIFFFWRDSGSSHCDRCRREGSSETMSSSFNHCQDSFLRVGDAVRSRLDRERSSLDISLVRGPKKSVASRSESQLTDSSSHGPDVHFASMESMWKAATRGTWISQTEVEAIAGTIKSIDIVAKSAEVIVWKRGASTTASEKRRPVEVYPLKSLVKMDPHEFDVTVRRDFMKDATYNLRLHNDGFDDSAPYALIAYNNKIISQLMGKIDTSAKMSLKDLRRKRPQGPAQLIHSPIPPMPVEVVDPLHAARAELQALQSVGVHKARSRSALSGKTHDGEAALAERHVCSRGLPASSSPLSLTEEIVFNERRIASHRVAGIMHASLHDRGGSASVAPSSLLPNIGNGTKAFISALEEPDDSRKIRGVVTEVHKDGSVVIRQRSDSRSMTCHLASVVIWPCDATFARMMQLLNVEVEVVPMSRNSSGALDVRMYIRGERFQEELVRSGLACVLNGSEEETSTRLSTLQRSAMSKRLGMWAGETLTVSDTVSLDNSVGEGSSMPALFDVFASTVMAVQRGTSDVE